MFFIRSFLVIRKKKWIDQSILEFGFVAFIILRSILFIKKWNAYLSLTCLISIFLTHSLTLIQRINCFDNDSISSLRASPH